MLHAGIIIQHGVSCTMSAKECLTQHTPVEHHFIQVDQPMSKFGMHFYDMGGPLHIQSTVPSFCVYIRL